MRKFIERAPARQVVRLSVEEEAILIDEQQQRLDDINSNDAQVDRLLDTSEVIDDVHAAVATVEEPGEVEQELVTAVADMAVAGTDANADDVINLTEAGVVTESFTGDVMDKLKKLWEKIRELMLAAWEQIKAFFTGRDKAVENAKAVQEDNEQFVEEHKPVILLLGYDPSKDQSALDAKAADDAAAAKAEAEKAESARVAKEANAQARHDKAISDLRHTFARHKFHFSGRTQLVSVMGGVPVDFDKKLTDLLHYSEMSHKHIVKVLRDICYAYEQAMGHFESASPEKGIMPFCEKFHKSYELLMRGVAEVKESDGQLAARTKDAMLGGFTITAFAEAEGRGDTPAARLKSAAKSQLEVELAASKDQEVPLLAADTQPKVGIAIKRWLDFASSNDVKNGEMQLGEYSAKFVKLMDRLVNVQQSVKGAEGEAYHTIQSMIDMCRTLNKIIMNFTTNHIRSALMVVRAAQSYQKESNQERVRLYNETMASMA